MDFVSMRRPLIRVTAVAIVATITAMVTQEFPAHLGIIVGVGIALAFVVGTEL